MPPKEGTELEEKLIARKKLHQRRRKAAIQLKQTKP